MKVDLHIHSTYSDGQWTPFKLVEEASFRGVSIMAITDHDEMAGSKEIRESAAKKGITIISGIELNTDGEEGELHILGYGFDVENKRLCEYIHWRQQERVFWSKKIVAKLQQLGYLIDWDACWKRANEKVIVRTHIADELVDQGYFSDREHAFQALLMKGAPAFVDREGLSATEAIELIHHAGGKAFVAHPGEYSWEWSLKKLVDRGLDGIEVYYSRHKQMTTLYWNHMADTFNLLKSVGSDFHGPTSRSPYPIGSVHFNENEVLAWLKELSIEEGVY
ncbi:putative metal-dependent phosphoesterase TrpH [Bacillus thermophilus]|uniref:Metal-dependent phosphoesterase TrpH n=1 Tax=Siminovitchia thermophila TaxID=1245522 RepID=A0ABS2R362_9BACI|nr:PHP domain-containing protein [Siminovitchia thermophila]MBM7714085.1 putative metal-dependent phosphoesterase TrpH [Siminovitchia thermophila]ONK21677.1 hypothetical protein BLX87_20910 [Bacillus sp. VT-16-64]